MWSECSDCDGEDINGECKCSKSKCKKAIIYILIIIVRTLFQGLMMWSQCSDYDGENINGECKCKCK